MIRRINRTIWRFREWRLKRRDDPRIRDIQKRIADARRKHRPVSHLFAQLRDIRHKGLMQ